MKYFNEAVNYVKLIAVENQKIDGCTDPNEYLKQFSEKERVQILLLVKRLMAELAVSRGENMSGKCYECRFRHPVPGDTHSRCSNRFAMAIGDEHGINNGWFLHPLNFDPLWLRYCDGFEAKEKG